jgi:cell division protein FtsB
MASDRRRILRRLVWLAAGIAALWFGIEGGEYGTLAIWRQRQDQKRINHEIDSLTHIVDTLRAYQAKVERDPATQERIAREVFGMVRDKELLYRFSDSTRAIPKPRQR